MSNIRRLDPDLVNKIAAGEVIERPASVVKELIENSLDAGARRIEIELVDGGASLIRVTDDGAGIAADELPLAVAPHATSKIATVEDLMRVETMGFRGEALASIASVSHVRVVSRPNGVEAGAELSVVDGRVEGPHPCAAPVGTTVDVRNLFYNVPARRKFLRGAGTEAAHVTEQIARVALACPNVALRQSHQGRVLRHLPASADRRARIADFYGPELAADLIPLRRQERGLLLEGWLAPPASARVTPKWQYVFLNGRYIADRFVRYAVREAFRGLIEPSRHPVVFLFLATDPQAFDVNVHPTKIEVRWRDAGLVQSQVLAVLRETLLSRDLTPALRPSMPAPQALPPRQEAVREAIADYLRRATPTLRGAASLDVATGPGAAGESGLPPAAVSGDRSSVPATASSPDVSAPAQPVDSAPAAPAGDGRWIDAGPSAALQFHNTYLVAESSDGLIIIDQHALHERVLYEQFRERLVSGPLESQRLLIPETVEVSSEQMSAAEQHRGLFARLGVELDAFGPNVLAVQAFPVALSRMNVAEFVRDALDRLVEPGQQEHPETLIHALLDMMACKAAVKAGDPLSAEEIQSLLAQRHLVDRSSNCPHGRPTTLRLTIHDLERQFKRST